MKIFLNFSNPTLVSTGLKFDFLNIKVLKGKYFKSVEGNVSMDIKINGFNKTQI